MSKLIPGRNKNSKETEEKRKEFPNHFLDWDDEDDQWLIENYPISSQGELEDHLRRPYKSIKNRHYIVKKREDNKRFRSPARMTIEGGSPRKVANSKKTKVAVNTSGHSDEVRIPFRSLTIDSSTNELVIKFGESS